MSIRLIINLVKDNRIHFVFILKLLALRILTVKDWPVTQLGRLDEGTEHNATTKSAYYVPYPAVLRRHVGHFSTIPAALVNSGLSTGSPASVRMVSGETPGRSSTFSFAGSPTT